MGNAKIIKLELSTKILLSLFNFFAPIAMTFLIIASVVEVFSIKCTIWSLVAILFGLFSLIFNLVKYNKFLCVSDKTITICKGKADAPKVEQIINVDNVTSKIPDREISLKLEKKKVTLLHVYPSIVGLVCFAGPLIFIPIYKSMYVVSQKSLEIYDVLPNLFDKQPKNHTKGENILVNVLAWGFVLFISFVGLLGMLYTPIYPFLNQ